MKGEAEEKLTLNLSYYIMYIYLLNTYKHVISVNKFNITVAANK